MKYIRNWNTRRRRNIFIYLTLFVLALFVLGLVATSSFFLVSKPIVAPFINKNPDEATTDTSDITKEDIDNPDNDIVLDNKVIRLKYKISDTTEIGQFNGYLLDKSYDSAVSLLNSWILNNKKIKSDLFYSYNVEFSFGEETELKEDTKSFDLKINNKSNNENILTYRFVNETIPKEYIIDGPSKEDLDNIIKNNETIKVVVYSNSDSSEWTQVTNPSNWTSAKELLKNSYALNTLLSTSKNKPQYSFNVDYFMFQNVVFESATLSNLVFKILVKEETEEKEIRFELTRLDPSIPAVTDTSDITEGDIKDPDNNITLDEGVLRLQYEIQESSRESDINKFNTNLTSSNYASNIDLINLWTITSKRINNKIADKYNISFDFGDETQLSDKTKSFDLIIKSKEDNKVLLIYRLINSNPSVPVEVEDIIDGPSKEDLDDIIAKKETVELNVYSDRDSAEWNTVSDSDNWTSEARLLDVAKSLNTLLSTSKEETKWSFNKDQFIFANVQFISSTISTLKFKLNISKEKYIKFELTRIDPSITDVEDTSDIKETDIKDPDSGITLDKGILRLQYEIKNPTDINTFNTNLSSNSYPEAIKLINDWTVTDKKINENIADKYNISFDFGDKTQLSDKTKSFDLVIKDKKTKKTLLTYRFINSNLVEVDDVIDGPSKEDLEDIIAKKETVQLNVYADSDSSEWNTVSDPNNWNTNSSLLYVSISLNKLLSTSKEKPIWSFKSNQFVFANLRFVSSSISNLKFELKISEDKTINFSITRFDPSITDVEDTSDIKEEDIKDPDSGITLDKGILRLQYKIKNSNDLDSFNKALGSNSYSTLIYLINDWTVTDKDINTNIADKYNISFDFGEYTRLQGTTKSFDLVLKDKINSKTILTYRFINSSSITIEDIISGPSKEDLEELINSKEKTVNVNVYSNKNSAEWHTVTNKDNWNSISKLLNVSSALNTLLATSKEIPVWSLNKDQFLFANVQFISSSDSELKFMIVLSLDKEIKFNLNRLDQSAIDTVKETSNIKEEDIKDPNNDITLDEGILRLKYRIEQTSDIQSFNTKLESKSYSEAIDLINTWTITDKKINNDIENSYLIEFKFDKSVSLTESTKSFDLIIKDKKTETLLLTYRFINSSIFDVEDIIDGPSKEDLEDIIAKKETVKINVYSDRETYEWNTVSEPNNWTSASKLLNVANSLNSLLSTSSVKPIWSFKPYDFMFSNAQFIESTFTTLEFKIVVSKDKEIKFELTRLDPSATTVTDTSNITEEDIKNPDNNITVDKGILRLQYEIKNTTDINTFNTNLSSNSYPEVINLINTWTLTDKKINENIADKYNISFDFGDKTQLSDKTKSFDLVIRDKINAKTLLTYRFINSSPSNPTNVEDIIDGPSKEDLEDIIAKKETVQLNVYADSDSAEWNTASNPNNWNSPTKLLDVSTSLNILLATSKEKPIWSFNKDQFMFANVTFNYSTINILNFTLSIDEDNKITFELTRLDPKVIDTVTDTSDISENDIKDPNNNITIDKGILRLQYEIKQPKDINTFNNYLRDDSYPEAIQLINKWTITDKSINDNIADYYNIVFDFGLETALSASTKYFDLIIKDKNTNQTLLTYRLIAKSVSATEVTAEDIINGPSADRLDDIIKNKETVEINIYTDWESPEWRTLSNKYNWISSSKLLVISQALNKVLATSKETPIWSFNKDQFMFANVQFSSSTISKLNFKIVISEEDEKEIKFELTRIDPSITDVEDTSDIKETDIKDPDSGITLDKGILRLQYEIKNPTDINTFNTNLSSNSYPEAIKLINDWTVTDKKINENIADKYNISFDFGDKTQLSDKTKSFDLVIRDKINAKTLLTYRFINSSPSNPTNVEDIIDGPSKEDLEDIIAKKETVQLNVYADSESAEWKTVTNKDSWKSASTLLDVSTSLNILLATSKETPIWLFNKDQFIFTDVKWISSNLTTLNFVLNLPENKKITFKLTRLDPKAVDTVIDTSNIKEEDLNNPDSGVTIVDKTISMDYRIENEKTIEGLNAFIKAKNYQSAIIGINNITLPKNIWTIDENIADKYDLEFVFDNEYNELKIDSLYFELKVIDKDTETLLLTYRFNNTYIPVDIIIDGPSKETIDEIITKNEAVKIDVYLNKDNSDWNTITTESNWTKENQKLVESLNAVLSTSKDDTKWSFNLDRFKLLNVAFVSFSSNLLKFKINLEDSKVLNFELTRKDLDIGNIVDTSNIKEEDLNKPDSGITYKDNVLSMDYRIDDADADIKFLNLFIEKLMYSNAINLINKWTLSKKDIKTNIADKYDLEFLFGKDNEDKVLKVDSLYFELRIKDKDTKGLLLTYRFNNTYIPVENIINGPSKETLDEIIKNNEAVKIDVYLSEDNSHWNTITTESNWTKENQKLVESLNAVLSTSKDDTKWSFNSNSFKLLDVAFVSFSSNLLQFKINLEDSKVLNFELTRKDLDIGNIVDTSNIKEEDLNNPDSGITYKDNVISMNYRIDSKKTIDGLNAFIKAKNYQSAIIGINNITLPKNKWTIDENIADNYDLEFVFDNKDNELKIDSLYFELKVIDKNTKGLLLTYKFNNTYIPVENIIDGPSKETIDEIIKNNEAVKIDVYLSEDNSHWNTITTESNWTKENQKLVESLNAVLSTSKDDTKWSFNLDRFKLLNVAFVSFSSNLLKFKINLEDSKVLNFELTRKDLDIGAIVDTSNIKEEDLNDPESGITYKDNVLSLQYSITNESEITTFNGNIAIPSTYAAAIPQLNKWLGEVIINPALTDKYNLEFDFGASVNLLADAENFMMKIIDKTNNKVIITYNFINKDLKAVSPLFSDDTTLNMIIYDSNYINYLGRETDLDDLLNDPGSDKNKQLVIDIFTLSGQKPIIGKLSLTNSDTSDNLTTLTYTYKVNLITRNLVVSIDQTYRRIAELFPTLSNEIKDNLIKNASKKLYNLDILASENLQDTDLEKIKTQNNWNNNNFNSQIKDLLNKLVKSGSDYTTYFGDMPTIASGNDTIQNLVINGYDISFNTFEYKGLKVNVTIKLMPDVESVKDDTSKLEIGDGSISYDKDTQTYTVPYSITNSSDITSFNSYLVSKNIEQAIQSLSTWITGYPKNKINFNPDYKYIFSLDGNTNKLSNETSEFNIKIYKKGEDNLLLTYKLISRDLQVFNNLFKQEKIDILNYDSQYKISFGRKIDESEKNIDSFINNPNTEEHKEIALNIFKNDTAILKNENLSVIKNETKNNITIITYEYKYNLLDKKLILTIDQTYRRIANFFPDESELMKLTIGNEPSDIDYEIISTEKISSTDLNTLKDKNNWSNTNFNSKIKPILNKLVKNGTNFVDQVTDIPTIAPGKQTIENINISDYNITFNTISYKGVRVDVSVTLIPDTNLVKDDTSDLDTSNPDISYDNSNLTYSINYTISNESEISTFNNFLSQNKTNEAISILNNWIPNSGTNKITFNSNYKYTFSLDGNTTKLSKDTENFTIQVALNSTNSDTILTYKLVSKDLLYFNSLFKQDRYDITIYDSAYEEFFGNEIEASETKLDDLLKNPGSVTNMTLVLNKFSNPDLTTDISNLTFDKIENSENTNTIIYNYNANLLNKKLVITIDQTYRKIAEFVPTLTDSIKYNLMNGNVKKNYKIDIVSSIVVPKSWLDALSNPDNYTNINFGAEIAFKLNRITKVEGLEKIYFNKMPVIQPGKKTIENLVYNNSEKEEIIKLSFSTIEYKGLTILVDVSLPKPVPEGIELDFNISDPDIQYDPIKREFNIYYSTDSSTKSYIADFNESLKYKREREDSLVEDEFIKDQVQNKDYIGFHQNIF